MTVPLISLPPEAPSRLTDTPLAFATKADAWAAWWEDGADDLNASFTAFNADASVVNAQTAQVAANTATVAADRQTTQDVYQAFSLASFTELTGTSASSVAIGIGSKSFSASTDKLWFVGMAIIARDAASADNYVAGEVSAYTPSTGALTITVYTVGGSGTKSSWLIYPTGHRYDRAPVTLATVSPTSQSTITFSSIPTGYRHLMVRFKALTDTSGGPNTLRIALSKNGVAYTGTQPINAADGPKSGLIYIPEYRATEGAVWYGVSLTGVDDINSVGQVGLAWSLTSGISAIRFSLSSGNFNGGSIVLEAY